MSLYISYASDIYSRSVPLFIVKDNKCSLLFKKKSEYLFDVKELNINTYKQIIKHVEKTKLMSFEILINDDCLLEDILEYLSKYLIDKELTIGLLVNDEYVLESNEDLLDVYGVIYASTVSMNLYEEHSSIIKAKRENRTHFCEDRVEGIRPQKSYSKTNALKLKLEEPFHEMFMRYLIKSNKDNTDVYKKGGLSRQVFSKVLSDKKHTPNKNTVLSLIIGLELPLKDARKLLKSAGYSLSGSIVSDVIVRLYIEKAIYNLDVINAELNEHGCPLLGWKPREKDND